MQIQPCTDVKNCATDDDSRTWCIAAAPCLVSIILDYTTSNQASVTKFLYLDGGMTNVPNMLKGSTADAPIQRRPSILPRQVLHACKNSSQMQSKPRLIFLLQTVNLRHKAFGHDDSKTASDSIGLHKLYTHRVDMIRNIVSRWTKRGQLRPRRNNLISQTISKAVSCQC